MGGGEVASGGVAFDFFAEEVREAGGGGLFAGGPVGGVSLLIFGVESLVGWGGGDGHAEEVLVFLSCCIWV